MADFRLSQASKQVLQSTSSVQGCAASLPDYQTAVKRLCWVFVNECPAVRVYR